VKPYRWAAVAFVVALGIGLSLGFRLGLHSGAEGSTDTAAGSEPNLLASSGAQEKVDSLPFDLPAGHLVVTLRVRIDSAVSGFIVPGARVCLITLVPHPERPKQIMSEVLLENLAVLHNKCPPAAPEGYRPVLLSAILTVAVKPEEVAKLNAISNDVEIIAALERNQD
jgi:Flp pilus assembly protein CpaB